MDDRVYWIWLSVTCGAGSRFPMLLLREYSSARMIFEADAEEIYEVAGKNFKDAAIRMAKHDISKAEAVLSWCTDKNVDVITPASENYPKSLLQLRDPPMVLFSVGKLPDLNSIFSCAVVGTRKMSDYGKQSAYDIGYGLAECGACVVSGMALGIDGMAMSGALAANGKTVAVLGCGIDIVYPYEHKELMKRTLTNGAVITEYAPGTPPIGAHFPVRNRIISGLCQATVVVEADIRSGALITARHALYQGRDLYAVPGRIGEHNSEGTLQLIKAGARVVTTANDIILNYEFMYPKEVRIAPKGRSKSMSADEAAEILHVSSSSENSRKYYGSGVYGGKAPRTPKKKSNELGGAKEKPAAKQTEKPANEKPANEKRVNEKTLNEKTSNEKTLNEKINHAAIASSHIELDMLGEKELRIYSSMTPDVPVLPDEIARKGFALSDVMSAMTMLEISGAVEIGSGGYYLRRSADGDINDGRYDDGIGE